VTPESILEKNRPAGLVALYASFAALQAFDAISTTKGIDRGAAEANPIMSGVAGNPAAFWTIKAATSVGVVLAVERLWKRSKPGAIAVMVIANGLSAALAAHNIGILNQQQQLR
jgi:hypothetical protein